MTVGDLASRLERLTPAQRRLLELRRGPREGEAAPGAEPAGWPEPGHRLVPLTPEQEAVWRRYQSTPKTFYNWGLPLRLRGDLDVPAMEDTVTALAHRHEALRARIVDEGGLSQRIAPPAPVPLPVVDLQHVPEADRDAAARAWVVDFVGERLDPRGDRLWRAGIVRLRPREHVLVLLVDELVCDDRSRIVLMRELVEIYEARRAGRPPRLAELTLGYVEHIRRRRRWLDGAEAARQARAWRAELAGAELLPLAGHRPRGRERTFRGARLFYDVPPALLRGVRALIEHEGVSLYMCLQAAFSALLAMEGGRSDVVLTTHVFNRVGAGSEHLVGNHLTHLLVRCRWTGDPSFRELLRVARQATLAAYSRKELPVWDVVAGLGWADYSQRSPIGQFYVVAHDDADPLAGAVGSLETRFEPVYLGRYPGELGVYAYHNSEEGRLRVRIEYDVELFDEPIALRFRDSLDALLARVAAHPERPLSALLAGLSWLAGDERR